LFIVEIFIVSGGFILIRWQSYTKSHETKFFFVSWTLENVYYVTFAMFSPIMCQEIEIGRKRANFTLLFVYIGVFYYDFSWSERYLCRQFDELLSINL
jgi:hypothetical protein